MSVDMGGDRGELVLRSQSNAPRLKSLCRNARSPHELGRPSEKNARTEPERETPGRAIHARRLTPQANARGVRLQRAAPWHKCRRSSLLVEPSSSGEHSWAARLMGLNRRDGFPPSPSPVQRRRSMRKETIETRGRSKAS